MQLQNNNRNGCKNANNNLYGKNHINSQQIVVENQSLFQFQSE